MPDKSTPPPGDFFAIPGYRPLAVEGRDAGRFAQAQFMSDVDALQPGQWHWSGWLTPKGRVVALFALLRFDAERLWLLPPDADPGSLAEALQRFVFRSRLSLRPLQGLQAAGAFTAPAMAAGPVFSGDPDGTVELDFGAEGGARTLRLSAAAGADDAEAARRWAGFDLAHALPRLDAGQAGQWTPQQLSLERLRAYSVHKGCYPGQEIVARTHFLGQARRGLVRLDTGAPAAPGDAVTEGDSTVGQVVCAAGGQALAVLPLELPDGPLAVSGRPCAPRPLQPGLAR